MKTKRIVLLVLAATVACGIVVQAQNVVIYLLPGPDGVVEISPNPAVVKPGDRVSWFASASLEGTVLPFGVETVEIIFHPPGVKPGANGSPFEANREANTYTFEFPGGGPGTNGVKARNLPGSYSYSIRFRDADGGELLLIDPIVIVEPYREMLAFEQIDFVLDGVETMNSAWGSVTLTSTATGCMLYFNLAVDGVWRIRNIPIPCLSHAGEPQELTMSFDLGVPVGVDVTQLEYAYDLTDHVLETMPGVMRTALVVDGREVMSSGIIGESIVYSSPPQILNGGLAIDVAALFVPLGFPNQECGKNECVPAAVSNSLRFLNSRYNLGLTQQQMSIDTMKDATGWAPDGAPGNWPPLKDTYMQNNGYPITTDQITCFDRAIEALKAGQDVEIDSKIHSAAVVSITKLDNGTYSLIVAHDTKQGESGGVKQQPLIYDPEKPQGERFSGAQWFEGYEFDFFTVECPLFAVLWWGDWIVDIAFDLLQPSFADSLSFSSTLTVNYGIGEWIFTSVTELDDNGWVDQDFLVAGMLGGFTFTSALDFDPDAPAFGSWTSTVAVTIAGINFGADFTLEDKDIELGLTVAGVAGDVTVGVDVTFGGDDNDVCDLNWAGVEIDLGFAFCCADIALEVIFDCDGFVNAVFTSSGIAIPHLPWVTIGATLEFTMQTKSLVLSPTFDFGVIACFDLYIDVEESGNLTIDNILIGGIGLSCDIGNVSFSALSYWGEGDKPGLLFDTDYWEVYSLRTDDDACCGPFAFDLTAYFLEAGSKLFDVALIDADMSLQVSSYFTFDMGLEINVEIGTFTEWTLGFWIEW